MQLRLVATTASSGLLVVEDDRGRPKRAVLLSMLCRALRPVSSAHSAAIPIHDHINVLIK